VREREKERESEREREREREANREREPCLLDKKRTHTRNPNIIGFRKHTKKLTQTAVREDTALSS
jgi:hypothetical protein